MADPSWTYNEKECRQYSEQKINGISKTQAPKCALYSVDSD